MHARCSPLIDNIIITEVTCFVLLHYCSTSDIDGCQIINESKFELELGPGRHLNMQLRE